MGVSHRAGSEQVLQAFLHARVQPRRASTARHGRFDAIEIEWHLWNDLCDGEWRADATVVVLGRFKADDWFGNR